MSFGYNVTRSNLPDEAQLAETGLVVTFAEICLTYVFVTLYYLCKENFSDEMPMKVRMTRLLLLICYYTYKPVLPYNHFGR